MDTAIPKRRGIFRVIFHIGRGTNDEMPESWLGAYATGFTSATEHREAAITIATNLKQKGYEIRDVEGTIDQLDPNKWDSFVLETWPEFVDHFPTQSEVLSKLNDDYVFYAPYAGYDQSDQSDA